MAQDRQEGRTTKVYLYLIVNASRIQPISTLVHEDNFLTDDASQKRGQATRNQNHGGPYFLESWQQWMGLCSLQSRQGHHPGWSLH